MRLEERARQLPLICGTSEFHFAPPPQFIFCFSKTVARYKMGGHAARFRHDKTTWTMPGGIKPRVIRVRRRIDLVESVRIQEYSLIILLSLKLRGHRWRV
jgi:hypothetical protein